MKQTTSTKLTDSSAQVEVNDKGQIIRANQKYADLLGYSQEELVGMSSEELLTDPRPNHGQQFEKMVNGEISSIEAELTRKDGSTIVADMSITKKTGTTFISEVELVEEKSPSKKSKEPTDSDDICPERKQEIAQRVRVDAPSGTMTLAQLEADIVESHHRVTQTINAAISLNQAVAERRQEEQQINPDSDECAVLREMEDATYNLLRRLEEGDMNFEE